MQQIRIGTKVQSMGINRLNCAAGVKNRIILIDPNPCYKHLAFDDERKRRVEVTQDLVIKYGLKPYTAYFYLVAKLNTDMKGKVIDSSFVVEYLQLSESLQSDFNEAVEETPDFTSLTVTKVEKRGPQGQDFSHIKVKPSTFNDFPEDLIENINKLRSSSETIERMWALVDAATSLKPEEYERLIEEEGGSAPQIAAPTPRAMLEASTQNPKADEYQRGNDFGTGSDDFDNSEKDFD